MGYHHAALPTRDAAATNALYTEVMGFELVNMIEFCLAAPCTE